MKFKAFALRNGNKGGRHGKNDNTPTPKKMYDELNVEFHFDHDPCFLNPQGLREYDGLGNWGTSNFVNPPYSKKTPWILHAVEEQRKGHRTVMLLPADTSTNWFHDLIMPNAEIRFIRGRVSFREGTHASYPSMLAIFEPMTASPTSEEDRAT